MQIKLSTYLLAAATILGSVGLISSCNKQDIDPTPIEVPVNNNASTIADLLNDPTFSILKAAVSRAGLTATLSDRTAVYTLFAPTDAAFQASGIPSAAALAFFRPGQLDTLLRYHIVGGQQYTSAVIPTTFPNVQLPSLFSLQAPSAALPPGLRMPIFPSRRGTLAWVNNIPLTQLDLLAANGVVHKTALLVAPPSAFLWNRIDLDANLTFLKAAIQRADSGTTTATSLQAALLNPAANLTVFAPSNAAFQALLTGLITQALIAQGVPPATAAAQAAFLASTPAVFSNPALFGALSAQTVRGVIVYHILTSRAFSVNIPTAETATRTLLNSAVPVHPGVRIQATFGTMGVTAATVQGIANPGKSNLQINPTPAPNGTSDQHYINGVLHVIDQVLRPQ